MAKTMQTARKAQHPGFTAMVVEAIAALKERNGSSLAAIKKYVGEHYKGKLPAHWEKMVTLQLKRLADKQQLVKVKASYKLGESLKKNPKKAKAAATPKKTKAAEGGEQKTKKKPAAKKPASKKATPKKQATPQKKAAADKPKKAAAPKAKKPATKKAATKKAAAKAPKKPKAKPDAKAST